LSKFRDDLVVALPVHDEPHSDYVWQMMDSEYAFGDGGFQVRMLKNTHSEYVE